MNTSPPTISGTPQQGQTLTEVHGAWTNNPSPTGYTYQWLQCSSEVCTPIEGAKSQTYVPVEGDVGHTIKVQETASNTGGSSSPATSSATAVVVAPSAPSTGGTPPSTPAASPPHPPPPPVRITLPLISNLHERLVHGTTLVVSFRLAVKARVRLIAHRGRKTVAKTPIRTFAAGNHRLLIVLNSRRWPTKIELQSRALAALPTISQ
jgi:hypothetical protein